MRIKLAPTRLDAELVMYKYDDRLYINGEEFDFSKLEDGATLPPEAIACPWILGAVERVAGELVLTVTLPLAAQASEAACFPLDIVNPPNGHVSLPT